MSGRISDLTGYFNWRWDQKEETDVFDCRPTRSRLDGPTQIDTDGTENYYYPCEESIDGSPAWLMIDSNGSVRRFLFQPEYVKENRKFAFETKIISLDIDTGKSQL